MSKEFDPQFMIRRSDSEMSESQETNDLLFDSSISSRDEFTQSSKSGVSRKIKRKTFQEKDLEELPKGKDEITMEKENKDQEALPILKESQQVGKESQINANNNNNNSKDESPLDNSIQNLNSSSTENKDSEVQSSSPSNQSKKKSVIMKALKQNRSFKTDRVEKKNQSFRKLFNLPAGEVVVWDYSAALLRHMLHHGRLYFSQNYICFYSNLFGIKVVETLTINDITSVETESKIIVNPGITIKTNNKEFHFTSFLNREKVYSRMLLIWKGEFNEGEGEDMGTSQDIAEGEEDELTIMLSTEEDKSGNFLLMKDQLQEIVSAEFPVSVVKFFQLFYSDESDFQKKYHELRGDKEIHFEKWSSHPQYGTFRTITYRAPVHAAIGPSTTRLEETQRYHLQKERLVIELVSVMHDIPYGDYFRVESKHEVTALSEESCKLTVYVGVNFTKKTFFEGKIKSNAAKESKESYNAWITLADEELKKRKKKRLLNAKSSDKQDNEKQPSSPRSENLVIENTMRAIPKLMKNFKTLLENTPIPFVLVFVILLLVVGVLCVEVILLTSRVSQLEENVENLLHPSCPNLADISARKPITGAT